MEFKYCCSSFPKVQWKLNTVSTKNFQIYKYNVFWKEGKGKIRLTAFGLQLLEVDLRDAVLWSDCQPLAAVALSLHYSVI